MFKKNTLYIFVGQLNIRWGICFAKNIFYSCTADQLPHYYCMQLVWIFFPCSMSYLPRYQASVE